jgi:hypothetical protein
MNKPLLLACLSLGASACATPPEPIPGLVRNLTVLGGERRYDDSDSDPVDEPLVYGAEFDSYERGALLGYELGVQYATDEIVDQGVEYDSESTEFYLGGRRTWELADTSLRPYVGAGAALVTGRFKSEGEDSDSDTVLCPYVHVGAYFAFPIGINVGLDYRRDFFGRFDGEDEDVDVDYGQLAATLGWSF